METEAVTVYIFYNVRTFIKIKKRPYILSPIEQNINANVIYFKK